MDDEWEALGRKLRAGRLPAPKSVTAHEVADYTALADEAYAYDANGNRTGSGVEIGAYNRLLSDGTYRYDYDGEGNRIRRYIDDDQSGTFNAGDTDVTEYMWDYRNRLVTVESYDEYEGDLTEQVDFAYDAHNQLVKRTVDPDGATGSAAVEQTVFVHDQGQTVLQFDKTGAGSLAAGNLSHRYLWGPVVDQLFTDEQVESLTNAALNETLWALTDRQGSVTDLVDSEATLRLHRTFDSFGNIIDETHYDASGNVVTEGQTGYLDEAFAYTGRLLDQTTGLQNNLNRWYDASIGRWLSEDPIGFNAGDANLYKYVGNGPVNATDPSGLVGGGIVTPGGYNPWTPPIATPKPGSPQKLSPPNLYCYYLTPGNSAPADPGWLNWGSETGFGVGATAGAGAAGAAAWGALGGGQFAVGVSGGGGSLGGGGFHISFGYGSGGGYSWAHGTFGGVTDILAGPGALNLTGIPIFAPNKIADWVASRPEIKNCVDAAWQAFQQGWGK